MNRAEIREEFQESLAILKKSFPQLQDYKAESIVESIKDWNLINSFDSIYQWFQKHRNHPEMQVEEIPLNQVKGWSVDPETGNIVHDSNDFFVINGARVRSSKNREVGDKGWDQPMMTQVGYDGGILGLLRKRFDGIPHYLVEAKTEPGNYGISQISPTLQATFSNLKKAHGGRKPHFAELFENAEEDNRITVLFKSWLSEDGGRLFNKRNLGMLIEVDEDFTVEENNSFKWISLYQIKKLLNENAWINPHVRGIIAHM